MLWSLRSCSWSSVRMISSLGTGKDALVRRADFLSPSSRLLMETGGGWLSRYLASNGNSARRSRSVNQKASSIWRHWDSATPMMVFFGIMIRRGDRLERQTFDRGGIPPGAIMLLIPMNPYSLVAQDDATNSYVMSGMVVPSGQATVTSVWCLGANSVILGTRI